MKKSLALILALIMVLCLLPVTALAASSTGHQISVDIYKVVLDSSKPLGYQNPEFVKTITVICQDGTGHSGYNHFVNLKEFHPTKVGLSTTDWTGWQFNGYYNKGNDQKPFYDWTKDQVNATANVTGSEPYPCSKNFYLVYKEAAPQTQDITLTYNANGGSGAPDSQTKTVESGKEATFTVSSLEPTRNNYDFKGWSTDRNAETASYHGGESITIRENTTLYAVWANHEHNDGDDDGYCDTDHECMHEKDRDGYCIVEGCTHPHEGDGACCPKKPDNKPDKPNPEPSATPAIDGLTGAEVVNVKCVTDGPGHEVKKYQLLTNSYEVGDVKGNAESGYTCDITVNPNKYVEAYNTDIGVNHTLDPESQTGTIKLSWNGMDKKWELANPSGVPVVFTVKCENQTPEKPQPPKPENTPAIPGLTELNEVVKVKCKTAPESHNEKPFGFDWFSCQVGEVINANDEYFCTITVLPNGYVKSYNLEYPGHTLDPDGQKETLRLKWDATDKQWENTESDKLPITFTVKCDTVEPTEPPKPNDTDIPRIVGNGAVKVHCNANTEHKDEIYGLFEGSFDIGDVTKDEVSGEYFCNITVHAGKYVDEYNKTYAGHTLAPESQTTGTITLRWKPDVGQDGTETWVVASGTPVEFTVKCEDVNTYTVTYKDGVGGTAFKDQVHTGLKLGDATPGFTGTPYRWNYTFTGWKPAVAAKVSGDAVYTAQWRYNGGGWTPSDPINPVPPVVVVPPKTGDMPFWYSIAQFLGLVK